MKNAVALIICFFVFLTVSQGYAQLPVESFESLEQKMQQTPKPILVFVHTDWCIYCKNMENSTFINEEVLNTLKEYFYFVSLNAEETKPIHFLNHTFRFKPNGRKTGIHELATELATVNGQISYPTITLLNSNYEIIFQKQSFLNANQLLRVLNKITSNDT